MTREDFEFDSMTKRLRSKRNPFNYIFLILTLLGFITFSLFILEESMQLLVFANFPAVDSQNWSRVKSNNDVMRKLNHGLFWINTTLGRLQPLSYYAYKGWSTATEHYLETLDSIAFAHMPEIFEGRVMTFYFSPKKIQRGPNGYMLINGKVVVQMAELPDMPFLVKGKVVLKDKKVIIQCERR